MTPLDRHSVSIAGVVVNDAGQVLVIRRRDNGRWEPPGGVLELGETLEDGVHREILEETGLAVSVDRLTGVYKNMTRGIVALVFRCTVEAGSPHTTAEAAEVRWLDPADVDARIAPAYAIRVHDAVADRRWPAIRSHDGTNLIAPAVP